MSVPGFVDKQLFLTNGHIYIYISIAMIIIIIKLLIDMIFDDTKWVFS